MARSLIGLRMNIFKNKCFKALRTRRLAAAMGLPVFLFLAGPGLGFGQEEGGTYLGASLDLNSLYIWRGLAWSQGAVLQPSAWTSFMGYNLTVWANYPLVDESGGKGFDEIDFTIQGTSPRRAINIIPGLNVFTYPRSGEENPWTAELTLAFYIPIGPAWFYQENSLDVVAYSGAYYAEFGLEMGNDLSEKVGWEASVSVSYASPDFNQAYADVAQGGLTAIGLHFGGELRILPGLALRPHTEICYLLQDYMRDDSGRAWRANFGITLVLGQD